MSHPLSLLFCVKELVEAEMYPSIENTSGLKRQVRNHLIGPCLSWLTVLEGSRNLTREPFDDPIARPETDTAEFDETGTHVKLPNVPAQARRANDVRLSTEARSRRCLEPVCWTVSSPDTSRTPNEVNQEKRQDGKR